MDFSPSHPEYTGKIQQANLGDLIGLGFYAALLLVYLLVMKRMKIFSNNVSKSGLMQQLSTSLPRRNTTTSLCNKLGLPSFEVSIESAGKIYFIPLLKCMLQF